MQLIPIYGTVLEQRYVVSCFYTNPDIVGEIKNYAQYEDFSISMLSVKEPFANNINPSPTSSSESSTLFLVMKKWGPNLLSNDYVSTIIQFKRYRWRTATEEENQPIMDFLLFHLP